MYVYINHNKFNICKEWENYAMILCIHNEFMLHPIVKGSFVVTIEGFVIVNRLRIHERTEIFGCNTHLKCIQY